jgi:hypothetical protein
MKVSIIERIKCFFGFHDWKYIKVEYSKLYYNAYWHTYKCKNCKIVKQKFSW